MGNVNSVESPGGGRRSTYKLSKPRTPATAGLLSTNGLVESSRRFSTTSRRMSLPYPSSPAPSPMFPPSDAGSNCNSQQDSQDGPGLKRSPSYLRLFRSRSSQGRPQSQERRGSIGIMAPPQSTRPSRANSVTFESTAESSYYPQSSAAVALLTAGSRCSVNYDMSSYEAKRLLNLVDETPLDNTSIATESQFQTSMVARRHSIAQQSAETAPPSPMPMPRVNSDMSLYTPMRRRSLLTPGVATRLPDPPIPKKSKARFSLPSTPACRDSMESLRLAVISIPSPSVDPDSVPRAITPCDADYRHTGVFKLGSLRITNGSPVRSPVLDDESDDEDESSRFPEFKDEHGFLQEIPLPTLEVNIEPETPGSILSSQEYEESHFPISLHPISTSFQSPQSEEFTSFEGANVMARRSASPELIPEIQLSPLPLESPRLELLTTSKHTALEDHLFEEEPEEYSTREVLDVRLDLNAKSLPPRPKLISEGRNSRDMTRSDSGIAASPTSEPSPKPLAKADSGYSSNVSLRSFSLKPPVPEKDRIRTSEVEVSSYASTKESTPIELSTSPSPARTSTDVVVTIESPLGSPPPVPEKDYPVKQSYPRLSQELSPTTRQNLWLLSQTGFSRTRSKSVSSPVSSIRNQINGKCRVSELSPQSPTPSSTLSIGSIPRKPGRLQRLLSSARKPLSVHMTHPQASDKTGIPPIPSEVAAKLNEHTRQFPLSVKRLTIRPEPSKETLGTILSVGSAELGRTEELPPVTKLLDNVTEATEGQKGQDGTPVKQASAFLRKPIIRKPVPIRTATNLSREESKREAITPVKIVEPKPIKSPSLRSSRRNSPLDASFLAMASERETYFSSGPKLGRSNTMTAQTERDLELHYAASKEPGRQSLDIPRSSTYLEPMSIAAQIKKAKTPPPVSMRTRNFSSLRVPPPLRARSTPPGGKRPSPSRQTSREDIHSYPPAGGPNLQRAPSLSRRSSREQIQSYPLSHNQSPVYGLPSPSAPPVPPIPPLDRRRSLSFRTAYGEHRRPNWEVQTDHDSSSRRPSMDYSSSRRPSGDYSRHSSLSSQSSQPRPRPRPQFNAPVVPQLRHTVSYDGYSYRRMRDATQYHEEEYHEYHEYHENDENVVEPAAAYHDNGPYPSMRHANGQAYVTDPWSGRPMPQQWDASGRYPPYVPRGHYRNRSLGSRNQYGHPAPYRVLHSYNSPAYRNVPIWG